jgi:hypothetical protein
VKAKGQEKAGDLNDFIKKRTLYPKKRDNNSKKLEGTRSERAKESIQRKGGFKRSAPTFKKGVKQPKSKRPGKDTRQR